MVVLRGGAVSHERGTPLYPPSQLLELPQVRGEYLALFESTWPRHLMHLCESGRDWLICSKFARQRVMVTSISSSSSSLLSLQVLEGP